MVLSGLEKLMGRWVTLWVRSAQRICVALSASNPEQQVVKTLNPPSGFMSQRHTHEIPASKKRKGQSSQQQEEQQTSPTIQLDRARFMTKVKQQRFIEIEGRKMLEERPVKLGADEWPTFTAEITRRKWSRLTHPEEPYNEVFVK
ncbi:hypothetical protein Fmac_006132 [Flemingia macrophylla]|uniref:Uncharacterized protein n=1 Tax=Flemingia macrophylla TaxID=520843 RepID=A0ABD1N9R3_9FABA